jgi:choline dehydrogenase-like flavoprotein
MRSSSGRGAGPVFEAVASEAKGILPWGADHHRVFRKLNGHRLGRVCDLRGSAGGAQPRVTLDPVLKDSHGIPAPRIDYTLSENSRKMMAHGIARATEALTAAGAKDICVNAPILYGGWHLLGTARMGTDPAPLGGERMGAARTM